MTTPNAPAAPGTPPPLLAPTTALRVVTWVSVVALGLVGALGVGLRLRLLLIGRSLWLDEAMLALNLCGRSFAGLLRPLDDDQGAPVGFLFAERALVLLLGPNEIALRLIPFVAGLASLVLIYRLVVLGGWGRWAGLVAVSLAAITPSLVYYAAEVKQYSSDVACGLGLLVLAAPVVRTGWTARRAWTLGLVGAGAVWFAHPAIFVLGGIGATLLLQALADRRRGAVALTLGLGSLWVASFATQYLWLLRDLGTNEALADYWKNGFLRFPPRSSSDLRTYSAVSFGVFEALFQNFLADVDLGQRMGGIFLLAWLVGLATTLGAGPTSAPSFAEETSDRPDLGRWWVALVVAPLAFAVLASLLGKYPLKSRLAIFTAATTLPIIASGIAALATNRDARQRLVAAILLGVTLLMPTMQAAQLVVERPRLHDARGVLTALAQSYQPGDAVVIDRYSGPPFRFYQQYGRIAGLERVAATLTPHSLCEPADLAAELRDRRGQGRVWFVLDTALPDPTNFARQGLQVQLGEAGPTLATATCRRYSAHLIRLDGGGAGDRDRDPAVVPTAHH